MGKIEKSIEVAAPLRVVYDQWTQFEEFPPFMEGVNSVRQLDAKRLEWHAEIAGRDQHWTAEIVEQVPDQVIAWRSTSGAKNEGTVRFASVDGSRTRVALAIDHEPEGLTETAGDALGAVPGQVQKDLERFRDFIEARGRETGGWRGEIRGRRVQRDDEEARR
ncbi:MAG: SRPBCC family protein [Candidatus Limnocylindria bacterium]